MGSPGKAEGTAWLGTALRSMKPRSGGYYRGDLRLHGHLERAEERVVTSADLRVHGFGQWLPFGVLTKREMLLHVPTDIGVYAIRHHLPYPRMRGESDILYVGSATNRQGLRMRLRQYFRPGPTQRTNKRLRELVGESADYQVAFVVTRSGAEARSLEAELLERYEADHGELPPQNRRR